MNQPLTRRDLVEKGVDALDQDRHSNIQISRNAGGVYFQNALEIMEFAKLMAVADIAVPEHLRGNAGACLRIVFQANEWQVSPWAVADKSYEVNGRLAYESQLIHAVLEARAPLRERLNCDYSGEGDNRKCRVFGTFTDGTTREYETPELKKIKKKSPLWNDDPDQQLFYYGSRAWGRKWCPDVIMGLYTKDELRESPNLGRPDEDVDPGLHSRLVGSNVNREEGHQEGHVEQTLSGGATTTTEQPAAQEQPPAEPKQRRKRGGGAAIEQEPPTPKTTREWVAYCDYWITHATNADEMEKRWKAEMRLRNDCGVTGEERDPVFERFNNKVHELREKSGNAPGAE